MDINKLIEKMQKQSKNFSTVLVAIGCLALVSQSALAKEDTYENKEVCKGKNNSQQCESCCDGIKKGSFKYFGQGSRSCVCNLPVGFNRLKGVCPFGIDRDGCEGCCAERGLARSSLSVDFGLCACETDIRYGFIPQPNQPPKNSPNYFY